MTALEDLTAALSTDGDGSGSALLVDLFGTSDRGAIATLLCNFAIVELAPPSELRFVSVGVGLVVGLGLEDGRQISLKVHRQTTSSERLVAVQSLQEELASGGFPAPLPLVAPTPLGSGLVTVEELLVAEAVDGHDPSIRRSVAAGLARFISMAGDVVPRPNVGAGLAALAPGQLWDSPHDLRFDFDRTASGSEWIDELAWTARSTLSDLVLPDVVAHLDWRVENLGFAGAELEAVYDWDSVGLAPESVAVGQASAVYSTDWRVGPSTIPDVEQMSMFITDYEAVRGRAFTAAERRAIDAANLLVCAYSARCEHSDLELHPEFAPPDGHGWATRLRERAAYRLI